MKKKWIIILLTAMLLLAACAKGADTPDAETPAGNPFFTCTGTEYGDFPILRSEQREAEAKTFLAEHRALLERAAADWPDRAHFSISDGEARTWNEQKGGYAPIDALTLSESLQALVRLSEEYDVDFHVCDPDPVFSEDAEPYFKVSFPRAIDTTDRDPGILYYVALIYTANTEEQLTDSYRHDVKPLDGNWFIETYFYAY